MLELFYKFGLKLIESAKTLWEWMSTPAIPGTPIGDFCIEHGVEYPMFIFISGGFLVLFLVFKIIFSLVLD